jgi:3-hydroxyacyl-CoA dehydrogenase
MFEFKGRNIEKIAVVGSGQIGPDIAVNFARVFSPYDIQIVVLDVAEEALEKGKTTAFEKIDSAVVTKALDPRQAQAIKDSLKFTSRDGDVVGASLVVEAATENRTVKQQIFKTMESLTSHRTILASNSTDLEPDVIFDSVADPSRTMVAHHSFPAERSPIVNIVPGSRTSEENVEWMMELFAWMGYTVRR